jgi:phosphohistidine phosphatase
MDSDTATTMLIYVLRHGIAEPAGVNIPDADRKLTLQGEKKLRAVLRAAYGANVSPDVILTSPYRRAVETAEVAAKELGFEGELIETNALTPGSSPEEVWEDIRIHKQAEEVLISGHEPLLSQVIAYLLGVPALLVDLKKGAIACIEIDELGAKPRGALCWLLTAKLAKSVR